MIGSILIWVTDLTQTGEIVFRIIEQITITDLHVQTTIEAPVIEEVLLQVTEVHTVVVEEVSEVAVQVVIAEADVS